MGTAHAGWRYIQRRKAHKTTQSKLNEKCRRVPVRTKKASSEMKEYHFRLVISHQVVTDQEILDLADRLVAAGCDDGHLAGHDEGIEIVFDRAAGSRDEAMSSAVAAVEQCGLLVKRVELDREAIAV